MRRACHAVLMDPPPPALPDLPPQPEVYSLALSLAQAPTAAAGATSQLVSSRLAAAALQLLDVLPSSPAACQQLCQLLLAPDGGHLLLQLLMRQEPAAGAAAGAVKPAVLMYAVQCLCGLLFPQGAATMETATAESLQLEALQRRLLLSGTLEALLELATRQASAQAVDAAEAAAGAAAAAVAAQAAAEEPEEAAGAAGSAAICEPTSMQIDSAPPADDDVAAGERPEAAASAPQAPAAAGSAAAHDPSPSFSMATEASAADADALTAAVGDAELAQAPAAVADAELAAGVGAAAAAMEELQPAADVLASLAPAVACYVLRMLCCVLRCHPAAGQQQQLAAPVDGGPVGELCSQALLLLKQLARHSSAAVQVITSAEAAATEAVVHSLLLHPTSSNLRQLAAEWLPAFAAASPEAHRWAFERIVQPLLLAEAGSGSGGSSSQEQMTLCNHFIETLDYSEVPAVAPLLAAALSAAPRACMFALENSPACIYTWLAAQPCLYVTYDAAPPPSLPQVPVARQLLQTLLQRLHAAIADMEPTDGIASVVGALIRRLDCREVGLVSGRGAHVENRMGRQRRCCCPVHCGGAGLSLPHMCACAACPADPQPCQPAHPGLLLPSHHSVQSVAIDHLCCQPSGVGSRSSGFHLGPPGWLLRAATGGGICSSHRQRSCSGRALRCRRPCPGLWQRGQQQ